MAYRLLFRAACWNSFVFHRKYNHWRILRKSTCAERTFCRGWTRVSWPKDCVTAREPVRWSVCWSLVLTMVKLRMRLQAKGSAAGSVVARSLESSLETVYLDVGIYIGILCEPQCVMYRTYVFWLKVQVSLWWAGHACLPNDCVEEPVVIFVTMSWEASLIRSRGGWEAGSCGNRLPLTHISGSSPLVFDRSLDSTWLRR